MSNLKLIDGKRFDIRQYLIAVYDREDVSFFLFDRFYLRHASRLYDQLSMEKSENAINADKGRTFSFPYKNELYKQIMNEAIEKLGKMLKMVSISNSNNIKGFHILGIDWLMDSDDKLWFIEVNHRPTLCHDDICKQAGDLVKIIIQRVVEPLLAGRKIRTKRLIRV